MALATGPNDEEEEVTDSDVRIVPV